MQPTLQPGWLVLCRRGRPKLGQIVVASLNNRQIIKRVHSLESELVVLVGDNQSQSDSYKLPISQVEAHLALCLWPLKRVK